MKIEAITLEEAYTKASYELKCSVNEIEIEIIQAPTNGIFGFLKKSAIVKASKKGEKSVKTQPPKREYKKTPTISNTNSSEVVAEIKTNITNLLSKSCFEIELVEIKELEDGTVYIKINGKDAPLMIGKEGYRYKALSYLFYNMFKAKFNISIKLEIAEFLEKQEEYIDSYLVIVKEKIEKFGRANTRVLDGVLLKLALEKLRASYNDKYVGIKTNRDGEKYIVINNFNSKRS